MTWNYRILRHPEGSLALHEVHYDQDGQPISFTAEPATFATDFGHDEAARIADLRGGFNLSQAAFERPILDIASIFPARANAAAASSPRPIPDAVAGRNEISDAAHAVFDHLETNQVEWADHQTWQDQIKDASIEIAQATDDPEHQPLANIREKLVTAAARLIDVIGEIDRCIAAGEV